MGLPQRLKEGIGVTQVRPVAICGGGMGLEGPWEAPSCARGRAHDRARHHDGNEHNSKNILS